MDDITYNMLRTNIYAGYDACLVGNPCQKVEEQYQFYTNYSIGDWIMETSSFHHNRRSQNDIGKFLRIEHLPLHDEDETDEDNMCWEPNTVIELFDGTEFYWYNASFIRVPTWDTMYKPTPARPHLRDIL